MPKFYELKPLVGAHYPERKAGAPWITIAHPEPPGVAVLEIPTIPEQLALYAKLRKERWGRGEEEESRDEHRVRSTLDVRIELSLAQALEVVKRSGLLTEDAFYHHFECHEAGEVTITLASEDQKPKYSHSLANEIKTLMVPHIPWGTGVEIELAFDDALRPHHST
jgi:hypothetical protein